MKWKKKTNDDMWADYYSENGKYGIRCEYLKTTKRKSYGCGYKPIWYLKDLENDTIIFEGKTLKSCKEFAEKLKEDK